MKSDQNIRKMLCVAATACAGLIGHTTLVHAEDSVEFDGAKARVNLSNKLEMLSQQIGSASCRLSAGIGEKAAAKDLFVARDEFVTIINGLEYGSQALGIPGAEEHSVVLESIAEVREAWKPVETAAVAMMSGGSDKEAAAKTIAAENLNLLGTAKILASDISGRYSNPNELTQADAMALRIAARQRTLGHQITKEVCGILTASQASGSVDGLGQSVDMYSVSLNALRDGMADAGVNPPPNDAIKKELAAVSATWQQSKNVLDAIRGGMMPTEENVEAMAEVSTALMGDMSNVVTLYMLATPGQERVYRLPLEAYARKQLSKWLTNEDLIEAVRAQNRDHTGLSQAQIDQLDLDWRAQRKAESKPMIDRLLSQPVSAWLRDQQAQTANFVTEVFAMDNHGLNVAQSVETSDYWQGDEAKWQATYGNGSGDIHISEVEFDESTGSYQSQVSMPITDPSTGEMIGAITFGINVQSLL